MKNKHFTILCLILLPILSYAQDDSGSKFLFEKFEKGKVIYKKGSTTTASFNYNILTGKMVFMGDNNVIMELANPSLISFININDRVFEHIKNDEFYEKVKLNSETLPLYIKWHSSFIAKGKTGAYGMRSVNNSSTEMKNINQDFNGHTPDLVLGKDVVKLPKNSYFLKIKGKFQKFNSFDSLAKIFKKYEFEIKEQLKELNLDFKNIEDVKKAVEYCSQFVE